MRGQRLFVRPLEPADDDVVRAFLQRESAAGVAAPATGGLLGKVIGELVAVLVTTTGDEAIRIEQLVVTGELRRKRIGGFMIEQLDALAAGSDRRWLIAGRGNGDAFLRRLGFEEEGETMRRRVGVAGSKRR